jgi:hypothetical protein
VRSVEAKIGSVAGEAREAGQNATTMRAAAGDAKEGVAEMRAALVRIVRTSTSEVDRRRHERLPASGRIELSWPGAGPVTAALVDVSEGGLSIVGPVPGLTRGRRVSARLGRDTIEAEVVEMSAEGPVRLRIVEASDAARRAVLALGGRMAA